METHLLLRESPRALALRPTTLEEAPSGVLVFEEHAGSSDKATTKLYNSTEFDDSQWRILTSRPVFGCLGLITVQNECFLAIVTDCVSVGRIRAGEEVYKIVSVSFYSLSSSKYDDFAYTSPTGKDNYDDDWDQPNNGIIQHPCAQLQKLFSVGNFYFTPDFDLTKTVQARTSVASLGVHSFDEHFLWNQFLISGLLEFRSKLDRKKQMDLDRGGFLIFAIRGYVGVETITLNGERHELSVISKLSCLRAGTRFNARGVDDNGHVANFVETETVLNSERVCYSYTQIRGSVPVFWEQQGMQLVQHKIQISRGPGATQPAVNRHFNELLDRYSSVCNVNLLSQKESTGECQLSTAFNAAVNQLTTSKKKVHMVNFDLHAECKGGNYDNVSYLIRDLRQIIDEYGYFLMDTDNNQIIYSQHGVFRTNCMDCLDRTNLVQNEISRTILLEYVQNNRFADAQNQRFGIEKLIARHSHLWAENGDGLSKIYAGTGALKSGFTRTGKQTFMNVLSDATRSVNRFYINNFQDKGRQEVIDQLLGKLANQTSITIHDPISDTVTRHLTKRIKEYSTSRKIRIFCGTYNLNGKPFKGESLNLWLLQHFDWSDEEPDLYVVGFQEIVELSPQQVMATDAEKRKVWEQQIEKTINSRNQSKYTLLRSNQLVGAALIIFAKSNIVEEIRNVETAIKKTGIMGMAGNKGAVAIRMDYGNTSFCFLAAHFASGHHNVDDRNADFWTINEGLKFLRGKTIDGHDNIVWVSDFNYRVSLPNEEVRMYANNGDIEPLLNGDQLTREMIQGRVFPDYKEGKITFLPTYKYDNGTDIYDTSEKQRIPGWTDRILFKGSQLKQLKYSRAELKTSDHRPVMALFETKIITLNQDAKNKLQKELYQSLSASEIRSPPPPPDLPKRKNTVHVTNITPSITEPLVDTLIDVTFDNNNNYNNNINHNTGLPPPSSDKFKWWEDGTFIPKADKGRATNLNPFDEEDLLGLNDTPPTKLPASFHSDNDWTPLSPVSVVTSVNMPSSPSNISNAIGFWNNKQ